GWEGDEEGVGEDVVDAVAAGAPRGQAEPYEGLVLDAVVAQRLRQVLPRVRRRAEAKALRHGRTDAAFAQVAPHRLTRARRERVGEESRRSFRRLVEDVLPRVALAAHLDIDAGALTERAQGFGKADAVVFHHERERVATLVTAEAVVHLPLGIHHEARRLLGVERTE